jgi:hypothetical protein
VSSRLDGKVLEPEELWEPCGCGSNRENAGDEGSISLGASSRVAAGHVGLQVPRLGKKGFGCFTKAAGVRTNGGKLVVRD